MSRLPIAIGASAFTAVVLGASAFVIDSGPVARSSAVMILLGILGSTLAGFAGLLLVRAPWGRWLLGVAVVAAVIGASIGGSVLFWLALVIGFGAIVGLSGPWLTLWVRRQPVAEELGVVPVLLLASAGFTPIYVGLAAYEGVGPSHWALIGVIAASAWAYGRGLPFGIWGFRLAAPLLGLISTSQTNTPGNIAIAAGALSITAIAWSPRAKQVTAVITPPLPAPVPRKDSGNANR
jgi:hypothetical protein